MYLFDKTNVGPQPEFQFQAMVHGLAIFAALTNLQPFSFTPAVDAGEVIASSTLEAPVRN